MDPFTLSALVAAGGSLIGGLLNRSSVNRAQNQYNQTMQDLINQYQQIQTPNLQDLMVNYTNPENVYNYDVQQLQPTAFEQITTDPRIAQAQNTALQDLTDRTKMGLTPEDQLVMNDLRRQIDQQRESQMKQLEMDAQRRGMADSGATEMRKMANQEALLNQGAEQADRQAAMNFQAKQNAIRDLASNAYNMRNQQYQEQANLAKARDAQSEFNTRWLNQAAQDKARMAQTLENQRANTYNAQQDANRNAYQTNWANQRQQFTDIAGLQSGQARNNLQNAQTGAQNNQNFWTNLGGVVGGIYDYWNQPEQTTQDQRRTTNQNPYQSSFGFGNYSF